MKKLVSFRLPLEVYEAFKGWCKKEKPNFTRGRSMNDQFIEALLEFLKKRGIEL